MVLRYKAKLSKANSRIGYATLFILVSCLRTRFLVGHGHLQASAWTETRGFRMPRQPCSNEADRPWNQASSTPTDGDTTSPVQVFTGPGIESQQRLMTRAHGVNDATVMQDERAGPWDTGIRSSGPFR